MMFTSHPEQSLEWSEKSVEGSSRFLKKYINLFIAENIITLADEFNFSEDEMVFRRKSHATLKKVQNDFEQDFAFNTAIAAIMELLNYMFMNINPRKLQIQKFCR